MIDFKKSEVALVQAEYEKVVFDPQHKELFEQMATIITPFINMNELAVRGFFRQAIVQWQTDHKTTINFVLKMPLKDRQKVMREGLDILYQKLQNILKLPGDKLKLKEAIDKAYDAYMVASSGKK